MEKPFRLLFFTWLIVMGILIFVPSIILLVSSVRYVDYTTEVPAPKAPNAPIASQAPIFTKEDSKEVVTEKSNTFAKQMDFEIRRYEQQVKAYSSQLEIYKKIVETKSRFDPVSIYQTVIKDTLVSLLTGLVTAIAAYVLVQRGTTALTSYFNKFSK